MKLAAAALVAIALDASYPTVAVADQTVEAAATITKMEEAAVARVCQASSLGSNAMNGTAAKVKDINYAVRCYSISGQLFSCLNLATEASALLEMERSGQKSFAEIEEEVNSKGGSDAVNATNALSLAESAPHSTAPRQLALDIYKQCSSYVVVKPTTRAPVSGYTTQELPSAPKCATPNREATVATQVPSQYPDSAKVLGLPRRPLQTVPGVATSKCTSPSEVDFIVRLG